ncbi:hypothetical protein CC86DRAFT_457514 [Ophiobolus disseminans]|uniref:Secreted protein n=1 Tax=Ophiobolus disseminans TaxID=1469910 RepID=A0A6A6ZS70_9PLEO|nr:hypothetical protein CC86DRAFT_457514 [Ophiobolus disseminans]
MTRAITILIACGNIVMSRASGVLLRDAVTAATDNDQQMTPSFLHFSIHRNRITTLDFTTCIMFMTCDAPPPIRQHFSTIPTNRLPPSSQISLPTAQHRSISRGSPAFTYTLITLRTIHIIPGCPGMKEFRLKTSLQLRIGSKIASIHPSAQPTLRIVRGGEHSRKAEIKIPSAVGSMLNAGSATYLCTEHLHVST